MDDAHWMQRALSLAELAVTAGEVPVGAVIVADGVEIGGGYNLTITDCDPSAHAEIVALRLAARRVGNYRLTGATLYVTVEPCIMCVGAIAHARLARVVFGCADPKAGALGSVYDIAADARLNHRFAVTAGVEEAACRAALQTFFQQKRGQAQGTDLFSPDRVLEKGRLRERK